MISNKETSSLNSIVADDAENHGKFRIHGILIQDKSVKKFVFLASIRGHNVTKLFGNEVIQTE